MGIIGHGLAGVAFPTLSNWADLGGLFSILSSIVLAASVLIGGLQIKTQIQLNSRERALDSYFRFTNAFADLSNRFRAESAAFGHGDLEIDEHRSQEYFRMYWQLQLQQWEFFNAHLLPVAIFERWMLYASDYFADGRDFRYHVGPKAIGILTFADAFDRIGRRVLRNQSHCLDFFASVQEISQKYKEARQNDPNGAAELREEQLHHLVLQAAEKAKQHRRWHLSP